MGRKIVITGHRPNKLDNDYSYTGEKATKLLATMELLFRDEQAEEVIVGMAQGTDTLAALVALKIGIPLTCAVPFKGQERRWPKGAQDLYNSILERATRVHYVHDGETPMKHWQIAKLMQDRNIWMVDQLTPGKDKVVAVWDGTPGGTRNCLLYASSKHPAIDIIRINPLDMQVYDFKPTF